MTVNEKLPVFEKFIQDLRAAWAELPDVETRMKKGAELLEGLCNDETMRAAAKTWPSTEGRKNLLFYESNTVRRIDGPTNIPYEITGENQP